MIEGFTTARVRAWTEPGQHSTRKLGAHTNVRKPPGIVIAFDTETTIDELQNLKIGAFLACWIDEDYHFWPFQEGLFYADDMPVTDPEGFKVLREYVRKGLTTRFYGPEKTFMATLPDNEPAELRGYKWYGDRPSVPDEDTIRGLLRARKLTRWAPDILAGQLTRQTISGEWMLPLFTGGQDDAGKAKARQDLIDAGLGDYLDDIEDESDVRQERLTDLPIDGRYGLDYWDMTFENTPDGRWWTRNYFPVAPYSSIVNPVEIEHIRHVLRMPRRPDEDLWFGSCTAFINDVLYTAGYPEKKWVQSEEGKPATVIGANLPFDISRIARAVRPGASTTDPGGRTSAKFRGGFQFTLLPEPGNDDVWSVESVRHAARVGVVRRGARGNMIDFISRPDRDASDDDSDDWTSDRKSGPSYFADILNLGWVLTNNTFSLKTASKVYAQHPEWVKSDTPDFGDGVTEDLITYCRRDVLATIATYCGMMREVNRHTPGFIETRSYSPASLAKAYYRDMGLTPLLDRGRKTSRKVLGYAMTTFYGARAECHVRRTPVPVAYTDFTSMYPTVDVNMKLWDFLTHESVDFKIETSQVQSLLNNITLDDLFNRDRWSDFRGIALIQPDGDILPDRTKLGDAVSTITIAHLTSAKKMWYTIPDLIASKLLHPEHKVPKVLFAYRFYPAGDLLPDLKPVRIRGDTYVDPSKHDFFKLAMEKRQSIKLIIKSQGHNDGCLCDPTTDAGREHDGCVCERCRQSDSLKVIANSGAYGMFSEFNHQLHKGTVKVHGIDGKAKTTETDRYDEPGEYCYPPVATLITGAARLMLAMLERCVTDFGGTWAMADTDSMAIVASPTGTPLVTATGTIPVLSFEQVDTIQKRFDSLNPYDPAIAPGIHILKREHDKDPRQLWAYAIAAKRYALFRYADHGTDFNLVNARNGDVEILPGEGRKEHGLGAFMAPATGDTTTGDPYDTKADTEKGKRAHVTEMWRYLIETELGRNPAEPAWFTQPVMCKVSLTSWEGYKLFTGFNAGKTYSEQIKPYGFVMSPVLDDTTAKLSGVTGLIAPFKSATDADWFDLSYIAKNHPEHGAVYRLTGDDSDIPIPGVPDDSVPLQPLRVKTWGTLIWQFGGHPEVKYCDDEGNTCGRETRGILHRHHLRIGWIDYISKESSRLTSSEKNLTEPVVGELIGDNPVEDRFTEVVIPILLATGYKGQRGLKSAKLADALHKTGHPMASTRSIQEFLARGDCTQVSRTIKEDIRDPLIRLAVREAVKLMGDGIPNKRWRNPGSWDTDHWDILGTCKQWIDDEDSESNGTNAS